ncbi:MAG TPA: 50S ribosomal protein L1 [Planctomycetota bacterium]|nr:50S ribosomal protein L1 [Planctomycetota bacterium]
MPKHGKRYRAAVAMVDPEKSYDVSEAVAVLAKFPKAKFDETVELSVHLGIDPKKADQIVRGSVSLPHGIGKELKVVVFAEGAKAEEARNAGALAVGSADLAEKVMGGWTDFDVAIAAPDMMKHVGKLGKVLGPQGKMPTPKAGTVTTDIGAAVREFKAGKIEFRNDDGGNVAAPMGKRSFTAEKLRENVAHFLDHLGALKPATVKGTYMLNASLSSSMSPGVRLKV